MARTGRPLAELVLSEVERETLEGWARRPTSAQALAQRSRIVLASAAGESNRGVARAERVTPQTVGKWRARFIERRLEGVLDEPRPGRPRTISDAQVERVIVTTLEQAPADATHWSTRSMAAATGLSQATISRIWRAFGLQPHRAESFKLSRDPQFIEKVRDVVGLYLAPPEHALVLCVDEKSQIQAIDRSAPVFPMLPGVPERRTHDYLRHGTSSLFAALDVASGRVIHSLQARHRSIEFKRFLAQIDRQVPAELDVHVIADNYATHKTAAIQTWLLAHPRFHMHFVPTGASWLNLAERLFSELTTKLLQRGVHRSVADLNADITAWLERWNENPRAFVWTKTADEILESLAAYCQRINHSGH
jgi:transposase